MNGPASLSLRNLCIAVISTNTKGFKNLLCNVLAKTPFILYGHRSVRSAYIVFPSTLLFLNNAVNFN